MQERAYNMFYGADALVFQNAKKLREQMTSAERRLYERLSGNQLGVRIRAQHPLSIYVVDFYCHSAKLVIEIDGDVHFDEAAQKEDEERTNTIEGFGLKLIRFTNEEIFKNLDGVVTEIKKQLSLRIPE